MSNVRTVIIHGPQGCGKTRNAEALRRHFKLERVIEDWWDGRRIPAFGALVLTNNSPEPKWGKYRVIAFSEAMGALRGGVH
ncbi:MAG TPA: hypothetical protein VFA75_09980 [Nevskia sp.]|nr:hypothetical protein [Nevskia sp.]